MAEERKSGAAQGKSTPPPQPQPARKSWKPKSPVEVVLAQITRQEEKVNDLREELKKEERELQKLQQAKKVLDAN
jgi:hypothetical protein